MRVILASASPRRKELLDLIGVNYEVMVSNADESIEDGLSIEEQSKKLGFLKARDVFDRTEGDRVVIGSDTLVIKEGRLYGKPADRPEAVDMIKDLSGAKHQVITSLAVLVQRGEEYEEYTDTDITDVYVADMTESEIEQWVDTGEAYDKAGAYAIQSGFAKYIDRIDGNYYTVIGLPVNKVYSILKKYEH